MLFARTALLRHGSGVAVDITPTFVATGALQITAGTTLNVPYYAGLAANDIAFIALGVGHTGAITFSVPGFTALGSDASQSLLRTNVWWKRLTGSESGTIAVTVSTTPANTFWGVMFGIRGALATGTPFEGASSNLGSGVSQTSALLHTTSTSELGLRIGNNIDGGNATPPTNWTEVFDLQNTFGATSGYIRLDTRAKPTAASEGATTVTIGSAPWSVHTLAMIPDPSGGGGSGGGTDSDTTAWVSAVEGAGGTVSSEVQIAINTLITNLKSDGVWTLLDRLWLFAAANTQSALTCLKSRNPATTSGSPAFETNRGYTGAVNAYIDTGYAPDPNAVNWQQDNACFFAWNNTSGIRTNALVGSNVANRNKLYPEHASNDTRWSINVVSSQTSSTGITGNNGLWSVDRSFATTTDLYFNGSKIDTSTMGSGALSTSPIYVFRDATLYTTRQCSCFGAGAALPGELQTALYTRLRTYMSSVGVP